MALKPTIFNRKLDRAFQSTITAKRGTVTLSKAGFSKLLKSVGENPKGLSTFTFKGDFKALATKFRPISSTRLINPIKGSKAGERFTGVIFGKDIQSLTLKIGTIPRLGSAGKVQLGESIAKTDRTQFRNFGLRKSGEPRLGYTLAQCAFSLEARVGANGGLITNVIRYGDGQQGSKSYNLSALHRTRVQFGLDARAGAKRT